MTAKKTTTSPKPAKAKKGVAVGPVRAFRQKLDYPVVAANTVDSFTGRKRVRMSFGRIEEIAQMPNLIEIQRNSYESFPQDARLARGSLDRFPHQRFLGPGRN
jgi:hypothetical protein